ncbi:MAG: restriction endonuclease subunit S [Salinispira sp.]
MIQQNSIPDGWREVKLGDIITLNYGKSLQKTKRAGGNVPVYSSAGLIGWHNKSLVNKRGIIVGRKGTIGSIHRSKKPFFAIDTAFYISEADTDCDIDFLFYLLSKLGLNHLNSDSAVPGLNRNTAYDQAVLLPPLPEQKAIAEILSSLDDKIDLLHRQNTTLEDMAQTLFRKWFVEDADVGWDEREIDEVTEFMKGRKPKQAEKTMFTNSLPQILIETFDTGKQLYSERDRMIIANEYDILMVMDGASSGRTEIGFSGIVGSTIGLYKPLENFNYPFFVFSFLKTHEQYIKENTTGSAIPHVDKALVSSLCLKFPSMKKVGDFDSMAEEYFTKKRANIKQIRTLENLRNLLLPKLMSGKVRMEKRE